MENRQRVMELLATRATEGLDRNGADELARLLAAHPEWADDTFDLAAAAIDQALAASVEPMPDALRARLQATAAGFSASRSSGAADTPGRPHAAASSSERREGRPDTMERTAPRGLQLSAWGGWLAAAAALVVATLAWWPQIGRTTAPADSTLPSTADERSQLLANAADALRLDWTATEDPAALGAGGDVVWSADRQTGYMRIAGLEANDPQLQQYQLWVFDAERDERYPVDGGVFDVPAGQREVVIPIRARLSVERPTLFAVTVERPGGVVVSGRERIVLVASVAG